VIRLSPTGDRGLPVVEFNLYQVRSLFLTSKLPVARWHEQIGDPTVADGILDRLVHKAHRIEMRGGTTHKKRGKPKT
jgi:DNA replication protein DnaC